ncbi:cytochrome b/b6 domain-containing protein [Nodosilinea nodulosa]|uniref:cytochrome b/b6 domain-containing protein n=1 Tax=Nodosilinea nodulosa TaxID=416001 RepID=UPI0002DA8721|nr:cytochrome b/b6 domain-containing protein [Nodosilinea nodulosa]
MTATAAKRKAKLPSQATMAKTFHWVNIIALLLMMASGLQIYNANPVFGGRAGWDFPEVFLLGGWLAGGRAWHFAIMWVYSLNLLAYGIFVFVTQRWQHRFASSGDLKALRASQNEKRKTFAKHRLVYTLIVPVLLLAIASGLAMYKPAQLHWLAAMFGNWQTLRTVHFLTVPIVLAFTLIHSIMALKVGNLRLVKSMFF